MSVLNVKDFVGELRRRGLFVTVNPAATTESVYLWVSDREAEFVSDIRRYVLARGARMVTVRISNHPKPGFRRMRGGRGEVFMSWNVSLSEAVDRVLHAMKTRALVARSTSSP